jgi:hypothetical protein
MADLLELTDRTRPSATLTLCIPSSWPNSLGLKIRSEFSYVFHATSRRAYNRLSFQAFIFPSTLPFPASKIGMVSALIKSLVGKGR